MANREQTMADITRKWHIGDIECEATLSLPLAHWHGKVTFPGQWNIDTDLIQCHGGVTMNKTDYGTRTIGFDFAHINDAPAIHEATLLHSRHAISDSLMAQTRQFYDLQRELRPEAVKGHEWHPYEVKKECENVARQIMRQAMTPRLVAA